LEVDLNNYVPITLSLLAKGLIFDYATIYYYNNPEISSAQDFRISDEEYNQFIEWLSGKEFDYTTKVEKTVEDLIQYAKKEKYFDDIENQISDLKSKVYHNKEQDLKKFKPEIKELLEKEIASRYYLRSGMLEASFDDDTQIQEAIKVLINQNAYDELLAVNR